MKKIAILLIALISIVSLAYAANAAVLTVQNVEASAGEQVLIPILLENAGAVAGMQFDLAYPAFASFVSAQTTARSLGASIITNPLNPLKLAALFPTPIAAGSGAIFNLAFDIDASAQDGDYPLTFSDIILGNELAQAISTNAVSGILTIKPPCAGTDNDFDYYSTFAADEGKQCCAGNTAICLAGSDCNDFDATVNPSATESCEDNTGYDGIDNNCDGIVDLNCAGYCDQDGDGYTVHAICILAGYATGECDDSNAAINPGMYDIPCDAIDQDCSGDAFQGTDGDGDGFKIQGGLCGDVDCDDFDDLVFPGVVQTMNCGTSPCLGEQERTCQANGQFTAWSACDFSISNNQACNDNNACTENDACSEGSCLGTAITCLAAGICVDFTGYIWTGLCDPLVGCTKKVAPAETCDNIDNDCDGLVDEIFIDLGESCTLGVGACEASGIIVCSADGTGTKCNAVPGTPTDEICDAEFIDEDCDGTSNEGCACFEGQTMQCGETDVGVCEYGIQTCDINGQWGECVGAIYPTGEICNGLDDDCNGVVDNGIADIITDIYGYDNIGECKVQIESCIGGGFIIVQQAVGPVDEACDGLDNNCNYLIDDKDADEDGFNDCNGEDKCVELNLPGVPAEFVELNPNHFLLNAQLGFGCNCEEVLYCKPGNNKGEFKYGCSAGTYKLWQAQSEESWALDCQINGIVAMAGVGKPLFENTDAEGLIDILDGNNDGDALGDNVDDMIEDKDPIDDPDHGMPDWHPKSKYKK